MFCPAVLDCSAAWCSAANTQWRVLSVVPVFLTGDVLECNIAHRRSIIDDVSTLSGRIGKVVAPHAECCKVARSNPCCG